MSFFYLASCSVSDSGQVGTEIIELAPLEFFEKSKALPQAVMLDLRAVEQVKKGALWGSVNKSYLDPHFESFLRKLDPEVPLLIYSDKGIQSQRVAKLLKKRAFREIYLLSGGYQAWQDAGF